MLQHVAEKCGELSPRSCREKKVRFGFILKISTFGTFLKFGTFNGWLVHGDLVGTQIFQIWYVTARKIWQPWTVPCLCQTNYRIFVGTHWWTKLSVFPHIPKVASDDHFEILVERCSSSKFLEETKTEKPGLCARVARFFFVQHTKTG
jgi:hypothetical protein